MYSLTDLPEDILYRIFDYFRENKFINLCKMIKIEIDLNSFSMKPEKESTGKFMQLANMTSYFRSSYLGSRVYYYRPAAYYFDGGFYQPPMTIRTNFDFIENIDLRRTIESIHNYTLRQKISEAICIIKKTKKKTFSKNEKYEHKSNVERQHRPFKNVKIPKRKWQN